MKRCFFTLEKMDYPNAIRAKRFTYMKRSFKYYRIKLFKKKTPVMRLGIAFILNGRIDFELVMCAPTQIQALCRKFQCNPLLLQHEMQQSAAYRDSCCVEKNPPIHYWWVLHVFCMCFFTQLSNEKQRCRIFSSSLRFSRPLCVYLVALQENCV